MKKITIIAVACGIALGTGWGIAEATKNDGIKQCPPGQEITKVEANGFVGENRKPPPTGYTIEDSVSGGGEHFKVRSTRRTATSDVPFRIECR